LVANMHFAKSTLHGLGNCWLRIPGIGKISLPQWLRSQLPKHFVFSMQLANPIGTIWSLADKLYLSQELWGNICEKIRGDDDLHLGHDQENVQENGLGNDRQRIRFDNARRDIAHVCNVLDDFGYRKFVQRRERLVELVKLEKPVRLDGKDAS